MSLSRRLAEYHELLTQNPIWVGRLRGVGVLNAEDCKAYCVTGPLIRAAGVKWDLRKAQPYSGYEKYDFDIPCSSNGETAMTVTWCAWKRCAESVRIIEQAVEAIPTGPILAKVPKVLKPPPAKPTFRSKRRRASLVTTWSATAPRFRIVYVFVHLHFVNLQSLKKMAKAPSSRMSWRSSAP